jgi:hypothetical protein
MSEIGKQIKTARRVSAPLVGINTPDPAATIGAVCAGNDLADVIVVEWDFIRGLRSISDAGKDWIAKVTSEFDGTIGNPVGALTIAAKLEEDGILFIHMAPRWFSEDAFVQAAWNLRDSFKANSRMIVFLGKQITLPMELADDVLIFDEPLPTADELRSIVTQQHKNADLKPIAEQCDLAIEALRGLPAFAAEQVTAMSLSKKGIDVNAVWSRKIKVIEQTPGLRVYRGGEDFASIGGCNVIKSFLSKILVGKARPNAIVFIDEIEKMLAGNGDTSGISQDQLGSILSYMQDTEAAGAIFLGPPGAAKSAIAKAAGNEGGIPTIQLDLGAAKGSLVGQSEQQLRQMLRVVTSVSNGSSLWIATCNQISALPPELRRRFTLGTYFFDLPTAEERQIIWNIWLKRYELCFGVVGFNDDDWTGAEIRQCCDIAWRLGIPLQEAALFVVPVAKSAPEKLTALREQANGRFLSASYSGVFQAYPSIPFEKNLNGSRKLALAD